MKEIDVMVENVKIGSVIAVYKDGEKITDFMHYYDLLTELTEELGDLPIIDSAYIGYNPVWGIHFVNIFLV